VQAVTYPAVVFMLAKWAPPLERSRMTTFIHAGKLVCVCYTTAVPCQVSPKWATSFPGRGSYEYDEISISMCLLCLIV